MFFLDSNLWKEIIFIDLSKALHIFVPFTPVACFVKSKHFYLNSVVKFTFHIVKLGLRDSDLRCLIKRNDYIINIRSFTYRYYSN